MPTLATMTSGRRDLSPAELAALQAAYRAEREARRIAAQRRHEAKLARAARLRAFVHGVAGRGVGA